VLGHYRLIEELGAGGMGVVFRAHDEQLDRNVALKLLPVATSEDPTARARLLREARTASQLNHPHICTIFDVGEAVPTSGTPPAGGGQPTAYLAMELVRGNTLRARLASGALPAAEVVRIGRQLADALAHAHAHGVIHRDFKSANIVLTPEGRAKVLDFGLAKRVRADAGLETVTGAPTLTQPGMIVGTLAYMAPEQFRGQPADARSDVWALGVVLHEIAAGALPFPGETAYEVSAAILHQPPLPLPEAVPAAIRAVIAHCLEKDPAQRYADGATAQSALDALATGQPAPAIEPTAPSTPVRLARVRGRTWRLAGLGMLALLIISGALVALDVGGARTRLVNRVGVGAPTRGIKLAVLPFANLTGDPEQEYLSDGVTQEMIAQLGRLHPQSLSVIAHTSVMRYKKTELPIDQIGRELGVDYVL
jgi:serine/threonine-protein kinase